jgi:3-oxoacyl-[acyl-carrier-protein] synthase II
MNLLRPRREVCLTGAGLVSSLADGTEEHWDRLQGSVQPVVKELGATGYLAHPLPQIDFSSQIANPLELKRMSRTHALGCYAAGRALASARLIASEALARAIVIVSGSGGERDVRLDERILAEPRHFSEPALLNQELAVRTRPSLFLAQLPNLLAGNICILFGIKGGSRTTMGEELAGSTAFKMGWDLIADGKHDLALIGSAFNAERWDTLLLYGFGKFLWPYEYQSVMRRSDRGGGCIFGTMAAFLVLEAREHAAARGAAAWCRVGGLELRHTSRHPDDVGYALGEIWHELASIKDCRPTAVISGATGVAPCTEEETSWLALLSTARKRPAIRYPGSLFGHGMDASFLFNIGLAALTLRQGHIYRPQAGDPPDQRESSTLDRVLVTSVGHFRGEAAALLYHA